jgi:hypothetical protein
LNMGYTPWYYAFFFFLADYAPSWHLPLPLRCLPYRWSCQDSKAINTL